MTDAPFPTTPDELDAAALDDYLRRAGVLGSGAVVAATYELIGTGKMGDNARYRLTFEDAPDDAPTTVVVKFPSLDEETRQKAAGGSIYRKEVAFYRHFAPECRMRTPRIFGTELSDDGSSFLLVMEDLHPAEPGTQMIGESQEHARWVAGEAARLAGSFYGDPRLTASEDITSPYEDDSVVFVVALLEDAWPRFLDRFGHGLGDECIAFGDHFMPRYGRFTQRYSGPRTLVHADLRSENILFDDAGATATTVDWQTTQETSPLADFAYFMGGSVDVEDRRAWERDLVEVHRGELSANGIELSADEAWELYREYAMHGIMITVLGATYSTADERSDAMFLTMIQRHLQHCVDLDAARLL